MLKSMMDVVFNDGHVRSRDELVDIFGVCDRQVREMIQNARRAGMPIVALPDGGYKLATTAEEKQKLLHDYKGRALNMLVTYSALVKGAQIDGQQTVEDLMREVTG